MNRSKNPSLELIISRFENFKNTQEKPEYAHLIRDYFNDFPISDIMYFEPEELINYVIEKGGLFKKGVVTRFTEDLLKPDNAPAQVKSKLNENEIGLNLDGKCNSYKLKELREDYIYFDSIVCELERSLEMVSENLVFLSFQECELQEDDMPFINKILEKYSSIQGINLQTNRITLHDQKDIDLVNGIFEKYPNVQINFSGNYCHSDIATLRMLYEKKKSLTGYIWIRENQFASNHWEDLLRQNEMEDADIKLIFNAHRQFYKLRRNFQ